MPGKFSVQEGCARTAVSRASCTVSQLKYNSEGERLLRRNIQHPCSRRALEPSP